MLHDQVNQPTGPGGHSGTTQKSSVTDLTPDVGSSDKPLPGPATPKPRTPIRAASGLKGEQMRAPPQQPMRMADESFQLAARASCVDLLAAAIVVVCIT